VKQYIKYYQFWFTSPTRC